MKIGLFGGSFDPIHLGHSQVAASACTQVGLDHVYFIPARQSPHKRESPGAEDLHRCAMIELAIVGLSWASLWKGELDRPSPSFSWQTVAWFRHTHPNAELFWILGADQWPTLPQWSHPRELSRALTFIVFPRTGHPIEDQTRFRKISLRTTLHPASSTAVRKGNLTHLDPAVADYIRVNELYLPPKPSLETANTTEPQHSTVF